MASPFDLTTLADCKAWLGLTSTADDAQLGSLVSAISQSILADLGRPSILPGTVQETLDAAGGHAITLRHWPATRLLTCAIDGIPMAMSLGPGQAGVVLEAADTAPPGAMQRLLFDRASIPTGSRMLAVTYRSGYEISGEPAIVPSVAPYLVTAQAPYGAWRTNTGVSGATASYKVAAGLYTFGAADAGASLTLSYGYVPGDLSRAACEWVADRYVARGRIGQSAKTLGGQETTSFIVKAMPEFVSRLLQPYRRVAR